MAARKKKKKPSEVILNHFKGCGIENPIAYLAERLECSTVSIRRYLKVLDEGEHLKQIYIDKIVELSIIAMENRPEGNDVIKLFKR